MKISVSTHIPVTLALLAAIGAITPAPAQAGGSCTGALQAVYILPSGVVQILQESGTGDNPVEICALVSGTTNNIGEDACKGLVATFLTAFTTGQNISIAVTTATCAGAISGGVLTGADIVNVEIY